MGMRLMAGNVAADAGDSARARELLEALRRAVDQLMLPRAYGWASLRLAELEIAEGDGETAARLVDEGLERLRPLGDRWGVARSLELGQAAAKRPLSPAEES
jgi:hypothetical protein